MKDCLKRVAAWSEETSLTKNFSAWDRHTNMVLVSPDRGRVTLLLCEIWRRSTNDNIVYFGATRILVALHQSPAKKRQVSPRPRALQPYQCKYGP